MADKEVCVRVTYGCDKCMFYPWRLYGFGQPVVIQEHPPCPKMCGGMLDIVQTQISREPHPLVSGWQSAF